MKKQHSKFDETSKQHERPHFSQAIREIAKRNLNEFESRSNESFITQAKIDRKLNLL